MHIADKKIFNERLATCDVTPEVNIDTVCHTLSFLATKPTRAVDRPLSFNMQRLFTEIKKKSKQDAPAHPHPDPHPDPHFHTHIHTHTHTPHTLPAPFPNYSQIV